MSRFFEALQRTEDSVADLVLPVTAGKGPEAPPTPPPQDDGRMPTPEDVIEAVMQQAGARPEAPQKSVYATISIQPPKGAPLLPYDGSETRAAEQYRIIRTKLIQHPSQPRMMVVSSPELGDGKSVTAANIAAALALKPDTSVLLVDGDFRRSSLTRLLGINAGAGLAEVLAGTCRPEEAILRLESIPALHVLPAGRSPRNPTELLDSEQWSSLAEELRRRFNYVILDAPPVELVADYDLIQAAADGVILVIRPDHTQRTLCRQAIQAVGSDRLIGVVMNCVPNWFLWKTLGNHDYRYYAKAEKENGIAAADGEE